MGHVTLAIDPAGVWARIGWARFQDGRLATLGTGWPPWVSRPDLLIAEKPQVYRQAKQKGDPNDLIDVAIVVGRILGTYDTREILVRPADWKGQVPKDVHHRRIVQTLDPVELANLQTELEAVPKALQHNALDAVGLGVWIEKKEGRR